MACRRLAKYLSIKIFTVCETLQKPSYGLDALAVATSHGYLNLYEKFNEFSHHGTHLCLVFDVAGPSFEDLGLTSSTEALPTHIVQRAVTCVLEELEKVHKMGLIHGAVTAGNIVFEIDPSPNVLDSAFAKLPPCTVETKVSIDEVEYPIVSNQLDKLWTCPESEGNADLGEISYGGIPSSAGDYPRFVLFFEGGCLAPGLHYIPSVNRKSPPEIPSSPIVRGRTMVRCLADLFRCLAEFFRLVSPSSLNQTRNFLTQTYYCPGNFKLEIPNETLDSLISSSGTVKAEDISGVVKFIQACLTLNPDERPTPDDLFRHEWVQPGFDG